MEKQGKRNQTGKSMQGQEEERRAKGRCVRRRERRAEGGCGRKRERMERRAPLVLRNQSK